MTDAPRPPRRLRRIIFIGAALALTVWLMFLDSHSVYSRVSWSAELKTLQAENAKLQAEVDHLEAALDAPITDTMVERIAREQYGMRRPGETVYPTAPSPN